MQYFRPGTLTEALRIAESEPVRIAAGCTDLFAATEKQRLSGPILDITAIPALRGIQATDAGYRIGATTTWTDIAKARLPPAFDALKQAALEVGAIQIQNAGTIAGNLCNASPAADGAPPLLALNASVELQSATCQRTLALVDFLLGVRKTALQPGELVTAITIPHAALAGRSVFLKLGARKHLVISIVMVAVRLAERGGAVTDAAVAIGSCSPAAVRAPAVEAALMGAAANTALAARVTHEAMTAAISPIDDIRGGGTYRAEAAVTLTQRAIRALTPPEITP